VKEPYKPTADMSEDLAKCDFGDIEKEKVFLKEGEKLWMFDNIRFLAGRAGFAMVKNGLVIKKKVMVIS
jgi:hypothetical protein